MPTREIFRNFPPLMQIDPVVNRLGVESRSSFRGLFFECQDEQLDITVFRVTFHLFHHGATHRA